MNLLTIAIKNLKGNFQSFKTYFYANAFSVMIFFIFAMLIFHPQMSDLDSFQKGLKKGATAVEYIIFAFLIFFISYAIFSYAKQRSKDYALLKIVGASTMQIFILHFFENIIIFIGSLLTGIFFGMVFSKLFFMVISSIIELKTFDLYFPVKAFLWTFGSFFTLFIVLNLLSSLALIKINLVKILQFGRSAQEPPKFRIILAIFGILLIFIGYYLAFTTSSKNITGRFFPVLVMVILGTYFFYNQSVVFILNRFKKVKSYYFKGINLLWISDLAYRVKSLTWVLFFTTIVIAVGLTSFSSIYSSTYDKKNKIEHINYYTLIITTSNDENEKINEKAKKLLDESEKPYKYQRLKTLTKRYPGNNYVFFVKKTDYKALGVSNVKLPEIQSEEALLLIPSTENSRFHFRDSIFGKNLGLEDNKLHIRYKIDSKFATGINQKIFVVLADEKFEEIQSSLKTIYINMYKYDDVTTKGEQLLDLTMDYYTSTSYENPNFLNAAGAQFHYFKISKKFILFLSFLIGIIFFISAGSMLYFNFYNHLQIDKKKYQNISKIGLAEEEMIKSSRIQMAILFFLPNIFAILHTFFAIKALSNAVEFSFAEPLLIVISFVILIQVLYFLIINYQYNQHLKKIVTFY